MTDSIMPDLSKHVFAGARKVKESKPKSEGEKREEIIFSGRNSHFWQRGLKPYIEKRIEVLKLMLEVELDGKESLEEVGARFVIANKVAEEMQAIVNIVEVTANAVQQKNDKKKENTKISSTKQ